MAQVTSAPPITDLTVEELQRGGGGGNVASAGGPPVPELTLNQLHPYKAVAYKPAPVAEAGAIPRALGGLGEGLQMTTDLVQMPIDLVRHPVDSVIGLGKSIIPWVNAPAKTAVEGYRNAQNPEAGPIENLARGVAGATPIIGPLITDIANQAGSGDVAGAIGKTTGALLGPRMLKGAGEVGTMVAESPLALGKSAEAAVVGAVFPAADKLKAKSARDMARALQPSTLQDQALTMKIADELAKRSTTTEPLASLSGGTMDAKIETHLDTASKRLAMIEDRLVNKEPATRVDGMDAVVKELEQAQKRLSVSRLNQPTIGVIDELIGDIRDLGPRPPLFEVIKLRRAWDDFIQQGGGHKEVGSTLDNLKMQAAKGAANLIRNAINGVDPELATANHDYSLYKTASDIRQNARVREAGKTGMGLPGRGTLLDDIIAGWVGNALGGPAGGAVVEGANLIRQGRPFNSVLSMVEQKLANYVESVKPRPIGPKTLQGAPRDLFPHGDVGVLEGPRRGPSTATDEYLARLKMRNGLWKSGQKQIGPAPPPVTETRTAGTITEPVTPNVQPAKSLPLPARQTGLDYGRGRGTDELQNWQYTGDVESTLNRPSGPGVLRRTPTATAEAHTASVKHTTAAQKAEFKKRRIGPAPK